MKILLVHGPNLQLLGQREKEHYGTLTLDEINLKMESRSKDMGFELETFQSNHEGEIVDKIGNAKDVDFIIMNPAALTHSSIAIHDVLKALKIPTVEVHLSNIYQREQFRHHSMIAPVAIGQISGLGYMGYLLALEYAKHYLSQNQDTV